MKPRRIIMFIVIMISVGCTSQKKLIYFHGAVPALNKDSVYSLRIFPGDILSIHVFAINPEAYPYLSQSGTLPASDQRSPYEKGYVVNENGDIKLPLIGVVSLDSMKLADAEKTVEEKLHTYIEDPIVTIKKLNFKVTVLGEVNKPGSYSIMNESATLPEVLGLAGDLTQFADRQRLRIIRNENNYRKDFYVDLSDAKSLSPANYYLHPDDIVYVQALKRKALQNAYPSISLFTSIVTSTIVVLTFLLVTTK